MVPLPSSVKVIPGPSSVRDVKVPCNPSILSPVMVIERVMDEVISPLMNAPSDMSVNVVDRIGEWTLVSA